MAARQSLGNPWAIRPPRTLGAMDAACDPCEARRWALLRARLALVRPPFGLRSVPVRSRPGTCMCRGPSFVRFPPGTRRDSASAGAHVADHERRRRFLGRGEDKRPRARPYGGCEGNPAESASGRVFCRVWTMRCAWGWLRPPVSRSVSRPVSRARAESAAPRRPRGAKRLVSGPKATRKGRFRKSESERQPVRPQAAGVQRALRVRRGARPPTTAASGCRPA